eukprot:scaffold1875_cov339-Prasinococcus_capsulatus_cf.AAC.19
MAPYGRRCTGRVRTGSYSDERPARPTVALHVAPLSPQRDVPPPGVRWRRRKAFASGRQPGRRIREPIGSTQRT